MFENILAQLATVAVFVQRTIALLKPAYQDTEYQKHIDTALSLLVSAGLCLAWGVDAFAVAGIVFVWPWLGALFTGAIAGLGSNLLNDVLALLEMWKQEKKLSVRTGEQLYGVAFNEEYIEEEV